LMQESNSIRSILLKPTKISKLVQFTTSLRDKIKKHLKWTAMPWSILAARKCHDPIVDIEPYVDLVWPRFTVHVVRIERCIGPAVWLNRTTEPLEDQAPTHRYHVRSPPCAVVEDVSGWKMGKLRHKVQSCQ
jgi:hypothetical protein